MFEADLPRAAGVTQPAEWDWMPLHAISAAALGSEDMPPMAWIAVIGGGAGSVAIYTLLFVLVVRAFRRDYSFLTDADAPPTSHEDADRGSP